MTREQTSPAVELDARALNWRFVTPPLPSGALLLPVGDEVVPAAVVPPSSGPGLAEALHPNTYPAAAVPDLARWAQIAGLPPAALLGRVGRAVRPGGWIYVGFENLFSPLRPFGSGSLRAGRALHVLARAGFPDTDLYLTFPDQKRPAYLVPHDGVAELDFFLRRLFVPYAGASSSRWTGLMLTIGHRAALLAPHRIRTAFAPSFAVVAERTS